MVDASQDHHASHYTRHNFDFEGANKLRSEETSGRIRFSMVAFGICFSIMVARLVLLGYATPASANYQSGPQDAIAAARPDLVDRNGEILATDVRTASIFAEPPRIVDVEEAIDALTGVFPDLNVNQLRHRLSSDSKFVWIKREVSPKQQQAVHEAGIPGIAFLHENRRFYPAGKTASHIVGLVNVDNVGIAGIEKYVDENGLSALREAGFATTEDQKPVQLSIDLRVQHALRDELFKSMTKYKAIAAAGIVLNAKTGEVMGMASLPDYDPNDPVDVSKPDRLNRITAGTYEMGSVFKAITTAMALDSGVVSLQDSFDARQPIRVRGNTISDFHGKKRILSVPEVFIYSSNIGTAKMALKVGREQHEAFLKRVHMLDRLQTELPESRSPSYPSKWTDLSTMTISFGHGLSVAPIQLAATAAAVMNGGYYMKPTFLKRSKEQAKEISERLFRDQTSADMRYLMRLNAIKGSGKRSRVDGYLVGGKTGTAEKVVDGKYSHDKLLTSFLAAFPIDNPEYVVLVMLDEPKGLKETYGYATAGVNAAPTAGAVIRRVGSILGVAPRFGQKIVPTVAASF
ncbi:cell division protein FtsI (penicillin-binding protein 3) [Cohaesibacter sp. ES.047]|uniref:peptidoglycan D,D-transpeptidase FtsI family protein n=1 Tax=Cohaesibacter sp. ES.047 TaxID=1798205 RepID=UPI000BBFF3A3|nr:penicillin-binding protein 2 [Cohaesibacter sp. ES.047]SNY94378.1 cell division protein FtsI (penicillin-binding protein 3) [Cohaesibacter sp. ES.047]